MTLPDVLALLVVLVAVPLNIYVALVLARLLRAAPDPPLLRERTIAAVALTINVCVFSAIFIQNGMKPPPLDVEATRIITRGTLLALSTIPAIYWIRLYRRAP